MTATVSFRWARVRPLCTTLVAFWCCTVAAQPLPAADSAASAAVTAAVPIAAPVAAASAPAAKPAASGHTCDADGGPAGRPSVGLVLSGGGARGYAHLGVLKVLEDNRIPIDCIAGTSMGAVVGGLYASGMAAGEMQKRLSEVNLADIAFDVTERADLPQTSREDERLYINGLTLGFGKKGVKVPVGLVQGNRLQALLASWTAAVPTNQPFDRLPIPYRAVATDLQTGQMVVLDHGSLPLAIRASMAMPGLFAPAEINGRALVDGGLVSNLPVDTARQMGANVVIAVDIGSQLRPLDALASPADVMQQMVGILIRQNVTAQRKQLDAQDVLLTPDLGSLAFTDFQNAKQAIAAGAAAATAALPKLKRFALTPEQYAAYRSAHAQPLPPPIRITRIDIKTSGGVPKRVVSNALHVKPGDTYDPDTVSQDLLGLTTGGNFESVAQQIVSHGNENVLEIDAREKYWGPNFLLFGLGMSSSSTDEGGFRLHVGYRRPWLTESGLEFRADTTIGSDLQSARIEFRQPLSMAYGVYLSPYAEYQRRYANLYDDSGDVKITQYLMQTARAGLDFGLPIGRLGDFRIGLGYVTGHGSPTYNLPFDDGNGQTLLWPSFTSQALTARAARHRPARRSAVPAQGLFHRAAYRTLAGLAQRGLGVELRRQHQQRALHRDLRQGDGGAAVRPAQRQRDDRRRQEHRRHEPDQRVQFHARRLPASVRVCGRPVERQRARVCAGDLHEPVDDVQRIADQGAVGGCQRGSRQRLVERPADRRRCAQAELYVLHEPVDRVRARVHRRRARTQRPPQLLPAARPYLLSVRGCRSGGLRICLAPPGRVRTPPPSRPRGLAPVRCCRWPARPTCVRRSGS